MKYDTGLRTGQSYILLGVQTLRKYQLRFGGSGSFVWDYPFLRRNRFAYTLEYIKVSLSPCRECVNIHTHFLCVIRLSDRPSFFFLRRRHVCYKIHATLYILKENMQHHIEQLIPGQCNHAWHHKPWRINFSRIYVSFSFYSIGNSLFFNLTITSAQNNKYWNI